MPTRRWPWKHDLAGTIARHSRRKWRCLATKGEKTPSESAQEFDVHPNQIKQWRDQLLNGASCVFGEAAKSEPEPNIVVKTLHAKIGELNGFAKRVRAQALVQAM
jgi:transposase